MIFHCLDVISFSTFVVSVVRLENCMAKNAALSPHPAFGHLLPGGEGLRFFSFSLWEKVPVRADEGEQLPHAKN